MQCSGKMFAGIIKSTVIEDASIANSGRCSSQLISHSARTGTTRAGVDDSVDRTASARKNPQPPLNPHPDTVAAAPPSRP